MVQILTDLLTFSGRISKKRYNIYFLFYFIPWLTLFLLPLLFQIFNSEEFASSDFMNNHYENWLYGWPLIGFIPFLFITIKRIHDTGHSGWNILPSLIGPGGTNSHIESWEGTKGPNKYGPDPLQKLSTKN